MKVTPEYRAWYHMKTRCYNSNYSLYHRYGGRGIKVCERWLNSFENFLADMGGRPSSKHTIDRYPNNDGNYEPSNCRWATLIEQANNKSNNRWLTENGLTMTLAQWARELNTTTRVIERRIKRGQPISENTKSKMVIDLSTGIFYDSIKDAAYAKNIGVCLLRHMISGRVVNRTNIQYA